MGKTSDTWRRIFEDKNVLDQIENNGIFYISAEEIREYRREPRLMAKFDHKNNLPEIFLKNNLSILPITRGNYVISSFKAYQELEEPFGKIQFFRIPEYIESINQSSIVSEAIALNCANASGIIADFLEDEDLIPTINGRMSAGTFSFDICTADDTTKTIDVHNSQVEIDASYEGKKYLSIFEAKQDLADDFLVRQLYYPFRVWKNRVSKPVKTVYMVYSNGIFNMYQYEFVNELNYNSGQLIKFKRYSISNKITKSEIESILSNVKVIEEPSISFPQADSFSRIVNLVELLSRNDMNKAEITTEYDFTPRQTDYYANAAEYLGLVEKYREKSTTYISLSDLGKKIMSLPLKERQLMFVKQVLMHRPFNETLKVMLTSKTIPDKKFIINVMKGSKLYNVKSDVTFERRASTVIGWLKWIVELYDN